MDSSMFVTDELILKEYPLPIAYEYEELLKIDPTDWISRVEQLSMVFEVALRYCSAIALSQYYEGLGQQSTPNPIDQYVAARIAEPTIDVCVEILRLTARAYRTSEEAFMPELNRFSAASGEGLSDGLGLATRLNSLVVETRDLTPDREGRYKVVYQQYYQPVKQFLTFLDFLRSYKLIRALNTVGDEDMWSVNVLTGPKIDTETIATLRILNPILPGTLAVWSPKTNQALRLAPYAIFQQCKYCIKQGKSNDFFLYERERASRALYLGLENGEDGVPHRISLDSFIDDLWRKRMQALEDAEQNWHHLFEEMETRTKDQIHHLREKYDEALYVSREHVHARYHDFSSSDCTGFLIVGDSGVGKTNLLCHLADEEKKQANIATLENCAAWDPLAGVGLDGFLAERYGFSKGHGFLDTLIHLHEKMPAHPRFVLFLDAVNEYIDPPKLFTAIYNDLLVPSSKLPWFKLVLSCRSETWSRIEGGFTGERHFFSTDGSIVHRLGRFDENEFRFAFEKYKTKYHFKGEFTGLSDQAKRFITFPLMLRLVAETSRNDTIPPTLQSRSVFEKYIRQKIGESNPGLAAISTKEHRIVNRLVELMHQQTNDRLKLDPLFEDEEIGQLVSNQSIGSPYGRLLDKNVLLIVGNGSEMQVRFTYDQVFEYLLGEYIWPKETKTQDLVELVHQAAGYPSLWGAIKFSLMARWDETTQLQDDELLTESLALDDPYIRSMLTDVFVTLAEQSTVRREQVVKFIGRLVKDGRAAPSLLGIEVAHRITAADVLETGTYSDQFYVRQMATQYVFFLWQRDLEMGTRIYQAIKDTIKQQFSPTSIPSLLARLGRGIDTIRGFHSLLDLSLLAISLGYRYPEAVRPVGKMLLDFIDAIPGLVLQGVAPFLKQFGSSSVADTLENGTAIQIRSMRPFFNRPLNDPIRKECAAVMHLKPHEGSLQKEMGNLIFHLAQEQDGFAYFCCIVAMMPRVAEYFESLYQFCSRLYNEGNLHSKYIALRVFTMSTHMEMTGPYCRQEHVDFCNCMILDFLRNRPIEIEYRWQENRHGNKTLKRCGTNHINYGCLFELAQRRSGTLDLIQRIRELPWDMEENKRTCLIMQGLYEAVFMGVATSNLNIFPVLETAALWFHSKDPVEQQALVEALSYIRSFFPVQTDIYLTEAPVNLRVQVLTKFSPIPLGRIWNAGLQVGAPWLVRSVPRFYQVASEEVSKLALSSVDVEDDLSNLGARIADIEMLRDIAKTLMNAGRHQPKGES